MNLTSILPPWVRWVALLAVFAVGVACGITIGANHEQAREFRAQQQQAQQDARSERAASQINHETRQAGAATQVANEGATHATQQRIRTVYRTQLVGADCRQPDGVSVELDGAVERANARVRAAAGAAAAPDAQGRGVPRH